MAFNAGDIEARLTLDRSQFTRELEAAQAQVEKFEKEKHEVKIGVELDSKKFKSELEKLKAELAKTKDFKIQATFDPGQVRKEADALAKSIKNKITFNADLDTAAAKAQAAGITGGKMKMSVDLDAAGAIAQANALAKEMHRTVDFDIKIDRSALDRALQDAQGLAQGFEKVSQNVDRSSQGMSTFGKYALIAAAATPPIAAALVAVPAILMAAAVPIAAIATGMDGIKAAALPLTAEFTKMKTEVSATFEQGLKPAMQNISTLMPTLTTGLQMAASGLSDMATQVTAVVSSTQGLQQMEQIFTGVNTVLVKMAPAAAQLVENILNLAAAGLPAFSKLGDVLTQLGQTWETTINQMKLDGTLQGSITALVDVIGSILNLLPPLVKLGAQFMDTFGPALAAAINGVASALSFLAGPLGGITTAVLGVVAAFKLAQVALVAFAAAGRTVGTALGLMSAGGAAAAGGIGKAGAAAGAAGAATGRFATAVGTAGKALPLLAIAAVGVGLAYEAMRDKSQEGAQAVIAGTQNINAAIHEQQGALTAQTMAWNTWQVALHGAGAASDIAKNQQLLLRQATDDMRNSLIQQVNALPPLEQAQARVTLAQQALNEATIQYGVGSREAIAYSNLLATAQQGVVNVQVLLAQQTIATNSAYSLQKAQMASLQQQTLSWATAYKTLNDNTKTSAEVTTAWAGALGTASEAARTHALAQSQNAQATDQFKTALEGVSKNIVNTKGEIDTAAKGGAQLQQAFISAAVAGEQLAGSVLRTTGSVNQANGAYAKSRQGLIEMGVAAGIPRANMEALANTLMTIPPEVKTQVSLPGGAEAVVRGMQLGDTIKSIPNSKSVEVKSITAEAEAAIKSLGLNVLHLPDGRIIVTAQTEEVFKASEAAKKFVDGLRAKLHIDGDPEPAKVTAQGVVDTVHGLVGKMGIDAEDRGASVASEAQKSAIDAALGIMGINAEDRGAANATSTAKGNIDNAIGTMGINAADRGANAAANVAKAAIDILMGTEGINAADRGANAAANATKSIIDGLMGIEGINAADRGALAVARSIVAQISRMVATIQINAVAGAVSGAAAQTVANARAAAARIAGGATGMITARRYEHGGIEQFAGGGWHGFTAKNLQKLMGFKPMQVGWARFVGPNTWRVVGDRSRDDEAYIPVNRSFRSLQILAETARRMGYQIIDMRGKFGKQLGKMIDASQKDKAAASGFQRPAGVPEGQWGWSTDEYAKAPNTIPDHIWKKVVHEINSRGNRRGGDDYDHIVRAITQALASRTVENLTIAAPQGATVKELVDEAMHRIRHVRRGVYRGRNW